MRIRIALCAALAVLAAFTSAQDLFNSKDRKQIKRTLDKDVRLEVGTPPYADHRGAWQVRLTPEGSTFLYAYYRSKAQKAEWTAWIDAKIAYDRSVATQKAADLNAGKKPDALAKPPKDVDFEDEGSVGGMEDVEEPAPDATVLMGKKGPKDPGATPDGLVEAIGPIPSFAAAVKPQLYKVSFGEAPVVSFINQAPVPPKYQYFRSAEGVISGGTPARSISDEDAEKLCSKAKIDDEVWRVMKSVSSLEGGFDSINTYDTGYISVGFIQFTTGANGNGSLAKVLQREKTDDPEAFEEDFRKYGIDVTDKGVLKVYSGEEDEELEGKDAVKKVIADKKLSGVFVRAGRDSLSFKVAQLLVAKERYYAADDVVALTIGDEKVDVKVGDVIRSEAGRAIMMDRKVNTGNINPLPAVLQNVVEECKAESVDELAAFEDQIVAAVRFRRDFLKDTNLSQPVASTRPLSTLTSRGGPYPRGVRKKSK